jgi:hypothetical protein
MSLLWVVVLLEELAANCYGGTVGKPTVKGTSPVPGVNRLMKELTEKTVFAV